MQIHLLGCEREQFLFLPCVTAARSVCLLQRHGNMKHETWNPDRNARFLLLPQRQEGIAVVVVVVVNAEFAGTTTTPTKRIIKIHRRSTIKIKSISAIRLARSCRNAPYRIHCRMDMSMFQKVIPTWLAIARHAARMPTRQSTSFTFVISLFLSFIRLFWGMRKSLTQLPLYVGWQKYWN